MTWRFINLNTLLINSLITLIMIKLNINKVLI